MLAKTYLVGKIAAAILILFLSMIAFSAVANAQATGGIAGTVKNADSRRPLAAINVTVKGTQLGAATDGDGRYLIPRVPVGNHTLIFSAVGYENLEIAVTVTAGKNATLDAVLLGEVIRLADVVVYGAAKHPQRITEAPAAISTIDPLAMRQAASTG